MIRLLCDLLSRAPLLLSFFGNNPTILVVVKKPIADLVRCTGNSPTPAGTSYWKLPSFSVAMRFSLQTRDNLLTAESDQGR